jgi:hypothetical protein
LNPNGKPAGAAVGAALAPNDLGKTSMVDRLPMKNIVKILGMDDNGGAGFNKLLGGKLHTPPATIVHLSLKALSAIVLMDFDRCLTIVSEKRATNVFHP